MPNINLAQRGGGHYDENVFYEFVEESGAFLDWWVTAESWQRLLANLRVVNLQLDIEKDSVRNLIKYLDKDLPADADTRFPIVTGAVNSPHCRRLTFYRIGNDVKQHINHLLLAASLKFEHNEVRRPFHTTSDTRNPRTVNVASTSSGSSTMDDKISDDSVNSWINPTKSMQEATASYFRHMTALDFAKLPTYNRRKFETEFHLIWIADEL